MLLSTFCQKIECIQAISVKDMSKTREPHKAHLCRIFCVLHGNTVLLLEMHRFCRKSILFWAPSCRFPPGVTFPTSLRKNLQRLTCWYHRSPSYTMKSNLVSSHCSLEKECRSEVCCVCEWFLFGAQTNFASIPFLHHQVEFTLRDQ